MATVNARGASGANYTYCLGTASDSWQDIPANYMFASQGIGGWNIHYVGQCDSAQKRLSNHERWQEAVRQFGATHVLNHVASQNEDVRKTEERDLIQSLHPPMNVQHRLTKAMFVKKL